VSEPTRLNAEVAERIFENMREGLPLGPAAAKEGAARTARSWREKGERPDAAEPYKNFAEGVEFAKAGGMAMLFDELVRQMNEGKNSSALLNLMGRLYPKEFGKRREVDIGNNVVSGRYGETGRRRLPGAP
jgi:hypothetical protein